MKNQNFGKPLCRLITMVAICMLSLNAMAYNFSYTHQGKTLYYNITSSNTVAVTYYSSSYYDNDYVSGDVVIPSSVVYDNTTYSVTSIGEGAFMHCSGLTSVTIPNSVTSIGNSAFSSCSSLTSVTIPNSVTSIGRGAFSSCSSLTSVTIPNSVTSIGNSAFSSCSSLTSVTIPNSVTSIGNSAFSSCSSLTSVTIPNSVTSIGEKAFYGCSGLTSVTIPNSVTSIGEKAFYGCSGLTTLNFNAVNCGDFDYHGSTFYSCPITTINIGDSVQRIPASFVTNNSSLTSVTIPNSVTTIGAWAFCVTGLTSITIPNSVTEICHDAFYGCTNLTTLNFNAENCQDFPQSYDEPWYDYPFTGTALITINIGERVQRIPAHFVEDCDSSLLSSITSLAVIPPTIDRDSDAFPNPNLATLTVPCGSLEAYTSSEWNNYFPNRIEEDCSVSLQTVESIGEFVLYPNPSSGFLTIEFGALQESSSLRVADLGGKVVKTFDIAAGTETLRLDLRDLPSGVYTLMIGNTTKKLIVE